MPVDNDELRTILYRLTQIELLMDRTRQERLESYAEVFRVLRADYLTQAEQRNMFPTRQELNEERKTRREWPVLLGGIIVTATSIASVIIQIAGH